MVLLTYKTQCSTSNPRELAIKHLICGLCSTTILISLLAFSASSRLDSARPCDIVALYGTATLYKAITLRHLVNGFSITWHLPYSSLCLKRINALIRSVEPVIAVALISWAWIVLCQHPKGVVLEITGLIFATEITHLLIIFGL